MDESIAPNKTASMSKVKNYALWLLGRQDYSIKKLTTSLQRKFSRKEFDNADVVIPQCIASLIEMEYLNDERLIARFTQSMLEKNMGIQAIKTKLFSKQLPKQLIDEHLSSLEIEPETFTQKAKALRVQLFSDKTFSCQKEKQKAMAKMMRKGFNFSDALRAVSMDEDEIAEFQQSMTETNYF